MKVWKDKEGNKLTTKEFITRWKDGIEGITPLQKVKTQLVGMKITLLGLFLGLIVTFFALKHLWWVGIILVGALINTGVQYLAIVQQRKLLESLEDKFKESEKDFGKERQLVNTAQIMVEENNKETKEVEGGKDV